MHILNRALAADQEEDQDHESAGGDIEVVVGQTQAGHLLTSLTIVTVQCQMTIDQKTTQGSMLQT